MRSGIAQKTKIDRIPWQAYSSSPEQSINERASADGGETPTPPEPRHRIALVSLNRHFLIRR